MSIIDYRFNKAQVSQSPPTSPCKTARRSSCESVSTCDLTVGTVTTCDLTVGTACSEESTFLMRCEAQNLLTNIRLSIERKSGRKQRLEKRIQEELQLSKALYTAGSSMNAVESMRKYSKYQVQLERMDAVLALLIEFLVEVKTAVRQARLEQAYTGHRKMRVELDVEREYMRVMEAAVEQRQVVPKTDHELLHELGQVAERPSQPLESMLESMLFR
jgi:hypothetical protein